jgi:hypothetical protein
MGAERMQARRRFRQGREISHLRHRQFVYRLVEIDERGGGNSVRAEPEIDLVEIQFENLVLRIGALDAEREQRLLDLARVGRLAADEEVLGDLLGNGGRTLRTPAGAHLLDIGKGRAGDTGQVDAAMTVKILVLRRQERLDHRLRDRLDRQVQAPLAGIFGDQGAVGRMNARHDRRLVILQLRIFRQVLGIMPNHARGRDRADDEHDRTRREQKSQKPDQKSHSTTTRDSSSRPESLLNTASPNWFRPINRPYGQIRAARTTS